MHVQVNTGNDTGANESWMNRIGGIVAGSLERFEDQLTTVEVFISDENSRAKQGAADKRCLIEARLAGMQPIAVSTHAATFEDAVSDCAEKIERTIERTLGRLEAKNGRVSQSGDKPLGPLEGPLPETD